MATKSRAVWEWKIVRRAICGCAREAESAEDDGQPRHVRGGDWQRDHHRAAVQGRCDIRRFEFNLQITLWLWFTVLFANFAEAMAEGRGKAQADTLRKARSETVANRILPEGQIEKIPSSKLRLGIWCWFPPVNSFRPTARSWRESRRWMSRRSPANPLP